MSATYLTVSEASDYLKIPEETLYKYARNGVIPASKVGRYWRFDQEKIDGWIRSHSNEARSPLHVLVIDDDQAIRNFLSKWLTEVGCDVVCLASGADAEFIVKQHGTELVLLDLMMPAPNGVETLKALRRTAPALPVVIVTAYFDGIMMEEAMEEGPITVLKKPVSKGALIALVARLGHPVGQSAAGSA